MSIQSSTSSTKSKARLDAEFEESASSFELSNRARVKTKVSTECDKVTTAYLHQLQKSNLIQPFGFLLAVDDKTFRVIAYSENAPEMLTTIGQTVLNVGDHQILSIGSDVRTLFSSPSAQILQKALEFEEVSLQNPILVQSKSSGKPFYAIAHRITGTLIIDFEPVQPHESPMAAAGTFQSSKLAVKSITRLQSVASGSIEKLCDAMVQEVFNLTGYDRVVAYKFHEDGHGEVLTEITKPGLESYVGLHYPATDIPQAARFLFMKNKVRMICDCRVNHVKVIQDEKLPFDLTFCGSTLQAPHSCHLQYMENMNSIASLVMSVVVNERDVKERFNKEASHDSSSEPERIKRLWGLVVCHNTTPRFIPFPLRYACEFLTQVFAVHVNKELELENHVAEKNILHTQTLLCDLLLRGTPLGIMSQSPNVMDLVKCDGAALLYKNKIYKLGLAPTDSQIHDLVLWLNENYKASTGFSTNSLCDAGYPGALALGDAVCGTAAVRVADNDWLFWFRSHTAAKVRWGGAKRDPGEIDDGRRMHPRSSFKAFLEVVKTKSYPWKDYEMHAIHFMQQILGHAFTKVEGDIKDKDMIHGKLNELRVKGCRSL